MSQKFNSMLNFPSLSAGKNNFYKSQGKMGGGGRISENCFKILLLQIPQTHCFPELVSHRLTQQPDWPGRHWRETALNHTHPAPRLVKELRNWYHQNRSLLECLDAFNSHLWRFSIRSGCNNLTLDGRSAWKTYCLCFWISYLWRREQHSDWERNSAFSLGC